MEFSYSTILGKITKKIDITKFLHLHFYKKSYAIVYTPPPSLPLINPKFLCVGGGAHVACKPKGRFFWYAFGIYIPKEPSLWFVV